MLSAMQRSMGSDSPCSAWRAKLRSWGVTRRFGLGAALRGRGSRPGTGWEYEGGT